MGYRSEVYIQINKNLEDEFLDLLSEHDLTGDFGFTKVEEGEDTVKYVGKWFKWYEEYKAVVDINSFIDRHYEEAALLCIGEDGAEHSRHGSPENFDMYVVSKIEW